MISTVGHAHFDGLAVDAQKELAGFIRWSLVLPLQRAAQVLVCRDIQESCLRVVRCRWPVFATPEGRAEGHGLAAGRLALWIVGGASGLRINARERILFHEGLGIDELDGV